MTPAAVVIPTLDEEELLGATLDQLQANPPFPLEVVVADGGSRDRTREVARSRGIRVVEGPAGRAPQMNLGAALTSGDPILFLHADCRLGREHLAAMARTLTESAVSFGSFAIAIEAPGPALALVATVANLRTRVDRACYGDQAIFVRRAAFAAVGGYADVPIMEDVILARRLRATGRFAFLTSPAVTISARRWQRDGVRRTTLRNATTRLLFELGAPPGWLRRFYDGWSARPPAAAPRWGEK